MSDSGRQLGEFQTKARVFASCFEPNGYRMDQQFSWLNDTQREVLGRRAQAALEQAFIETMADIYDGELPPPEDV